LKGDNSDQALSALAGLELQLSFFERGEALLNFSQVAPMRCCRDFRAGHAFRL